MHWRHKRPYSLERNHSRFCSSVQSSTTGNSLQFSETNTYRHSQMSVIGRWHYTNRTVHVAGSLPARTQTSVKDKVIQVHSSSFFEILNFPNAMQRNHLSHWSSCHNLTVNIFSGSLSLREDPRRSLDLRVLSLELEGQLVRSPLAEGPTRRGWLCT